VCLYHAPVRTATPTHTSAVLQRAARLRAVPPWVLRGAAGSVLGAPPTLATLAGHEAARAAPPSVPVVGCWGHGQVWRTPRKAPVGPRAGSRRQGAVYARARVTVGGGTEKQLGLREAVCAHAAPQSGPQAGRQRHVQTVCVHAAPPSRPQTGGAPAGIATVGATVSPSAQSAGGVRTCSVIVGDKHRPSEPRAG
jgi:hypothetical protein